ncbi:MAG: hypothetical protein JXK07_10120 [Spirochaetes bacterium]|nr:hypothetical protein [Spirochaetota bacterium]MBN2771246.1 hypothetical protein [Spirochaetota bacterium]
MTRKDLKILMYQKGLNIVQEALNLEVSTPMVYLVLQGKSRSKRIEDHLESIFGIPFEAIRDAWNDTSTDKSPAPEIIAMQKRICQQYKFKHAVNS